MTKVSIIWFSLNSTCFNFLHDKTDDEILGQPIDWEIQSRIGWFWLRGVVSRKQWEIQLGSGLITEKAYNYGLSIKRKITLNFSLLFVVSYMPETWAYCDKTAKANTCDFSWKLAYYVDVRHDKFFTSSQRLLGMPSCGLEFQFTLNLFGHTLVRLMPLSKLEMNGRPYVGDTIVIANI